MRTVILGATGFVGRALVMSLLGRGHDVSILARDPRRAARGLPAGIDIASFTDDRALAAAIASADAVVNLAGESIAGPRWTARRKQQLVDSRIDVTLRLVTASERRAQPLPVFVSASATGWYGDRGDAELDERSPAGDGFAADLCRRWETAASGARASRVVLARFGVILGREAGALAPLRTVYRLGLGGPIGDGRAYLPWIHLDDAVGALIHAIERPSVAGPVAVVSPEPVRQRDFARALAGSLHRPAILPTPRLALRLALGEAAEIVTSSQRVVPRVLLATGFAFRFPTLDAALADLADDGVEIERCTQLPDSAYLRSRGARYLLRTTTELAAPRRDVFAFFSAPENLAAITPPNMAFEILGDRAIEMARGTEIDYRIRVASIPLRWRTRIENWRPGECFVDSQLHGPYRSWWHEHRFHDRGDRTVMEDLVYFSPPLGPLGRLVVEDRLRRIFGYRRGVIRARFPDAPRIGRAISA